MEPPWLVGFETGDPSTDPRSLGLEACAEFIPHNLPDLVDSEPYRFGPGGSHRMYDYDEVVSAYLGRDPVAWTRYPCVAPGWDNSPRRQNGEAFILRGSTPEAYGRWLENAAQRQMHSEGPDGIVFVNAWNEWAEGAHLEPDADWGRAYLSVTRDVLRDLRGGREPAPPPAGVLPGLRSAEDRYHDLYERFVALQRSSSGHLAAMERRLAELKTYYESKLGWTRYEAEEILDMNESLLEQLRQQAKQMREASAADLGASDWLREQPPPAALDPAEASGATPAGSEDERRRDDGYDEPPGVEPPRWLTELEAPG